MKLLLISADFPPVMSGEASHAYSLALNLARRGADVHVLTSRINGVVTHPDFKVHPVMRSWSWLALPYFSIFLNRCAPDAIILVFLAEMYDHHPMMTFAATISKRICSSVQFVTQFESVGAAIGNKSVWTRLIRKGIADWVTGSGTDYNNGTLLRDSDRVIVLSDNHATKLAELSSQIHQKCVLIPPPPTVTICPDDEGLARVRGRTALRVNEDEFLIAYYGYVYPGKGVETLLRAFETITRRRSNARVVIIGGFLEHMGGEFSSASKQYTEEMQRLPQLLGIADRVIWAGPCPPEGEEGSRYLRAADICVLPFDDGVYLNKSSFAVAAAHKLPIITTQGSRLEKPFVHGENVFLCEPKDPQKLSDAIELLMASPGLRERLRDGVQTLASEWFSWERAVDRVVASLDSRMELIYQHSL